MLEFKDAVRQFYDFLLFFFFFLLPVVIKSKHQKAHQRVSVSSQV